MPNNNNQLTEDQKKQQTAVPTASAVPASGSSGTTTPTGGSGAYTKYLTTMPVSSAGGDEYSKWLETLANNKKIENTPTNAKTYVDYLVYTGQDPIGDYQAKVRQADLDYRKSLATFGQNAEKLARSGMTGSGYSDYITGQAYAQRAGTVQAAQRDANAQMKQSFANYGEYVAGLQAEEAQSKTVDNVELTNALNSVSTMMGNGASIDAAIAGLKGVYSDAVLEQVKQNYQGQSGQQNTDIINSATGVSNYKAGLDQQLATGAITQDAYNQQLQAGYNKNYEFVTKALNGDNSGLAEYAKAAGIDISGGITDATGKSDVIDHMASAGVITGAQRNQFYTTKELQSINNADFTSKTAANEARTIQDMLNAGQITEENKNQLLSALHSRVTQLFGGVSISSAKIIANKFSGNLKIRVKYAQGGNSGEGIDLELRSDLVCDGNGFREAYSFESNGKTIKIGSINGVLAYCYDGKYYSNQSGSKGSPGYLDTYDNAGFVAHIVSK